MTRPRSPAAVEEPVGVAALTEEILPALIARLRASRLGELEVRSDGWRVRLRRESRAALPGTSTPEGERRARSAAGGTSGVTASLAAEGTLDPSAPELVARSPAVGYFGPAPELALGWSVQAGDRLGSVDVLGIPQEVTAPSGGVVSAILAEGGQAVEYGQPLALIDLLGEEPGGPLAGSTAETG